jgi:hypothetical protein
MLHAHHGESAACDDKDHLPAHEVDQGERQDEEEEGNALFQVDTENDR